MVCSGWGKLRPCGLAVTLPLSTLVWPGAGRDAKLLHREWGREGNGQPGYHLLATLLAGGQARSCRYLFARDRGVCVLANLPGTLRKPGPLAPLQPWLPPLLLLHVYFSGGGGRERPHSNMAQTSLSLSLTRSLWRGSN